MLLLRCDLKGHTCIYYQSETPGGVTLAISGHPKGRYHRASQPHIRGNQHRIQPSG